MSPQLSTGRSFLNASANGDTGLVSLGVRKYDPVTGAFLSVDPVLETSDPGQLNGYSYGGGNPVTHADPSGAMYPSGGDGGENGPHSYGCHGNCGWSASDTAAYDSNVAKNYHEEAKYLPAEQRAVGAEQAAIATRARAAAYRLTHAGWRNPMPPPAPKANPYYDYCYNDFTAYGSCGDIAAGDRLGRKILKIEFFIFTMFTPETREADGILSGEAASAASGAALAEDLSAARAANPLIDSLRSTGQLPSNYVTKSQAIAAGWSPGKALDTYVPGGQMGGDVFKDPASIGLPTSTGRTWHEADIGLSGGISRAKQPGTRLLYSNDGLAFVTPNHYGRLYQLPGW